MKKIALVTGGYSKESEISYKSAETIRNNVDSSKWDCYYVDINNEGWFYVDNSNKHYAIDKNDFSVTVDGQKITFDVVLMGIHGTPGEDGKLQGYFDSIGIPYTSCDAATSAITFNKRYTVAVAAFAGIHVAKSMHLFKHTPVTSTEVLKNLVLPVFVKPNNGGSSIGMSKVTKPEQLQPALDKAFVEDDQVLVEEFITGREFTIGVFKTNGKTIAMPMTEIIAKNEFFDFEAKYHGKSEEITPADAPAEVAERVAETAKKIYAIFNCKGVIRIDFIYNSESDKIYMLEVNTVPGQSAASIVPQQAKYMGWSLKDFYSALIEECFNK